jgi:RND family efflux transporter MFP subunit
MGALPLAACHRGTVSDAVAAGPVIVSAETLKPDTFRDVVTANGTIVPSSIGDFTVYAPQAATIAELPKHENDAVVAGDVLVRFDIPSVSQALANTQVAVLDATSTFNRAKAESDRQNAMYESGLTARVKLDASRQAVTVAQSALADATSAFDAEKAHAAEATVTARFAGTIVKVWHAVGDTVTGTTTDPVLRVVDPTHVQASLQVAAADAARVTRGQTATVQASSPDTTISGNVIPGQASDPSAPTREVRVAFSVPVTIPIDTPVRGEILISQRVGALLVPPSAVQKDAAGAYVMIAGDDGRAHRRDVRLGASTSDQVQLASGVTAGERVITGGLADLSDDTPIALSH